LYGAIPVFNNSYRDIKERLLYRGIFGKP
jgi:hypothetical protein